MVFPAPSSERSPGSPTLCSVQDWLALLNTEQEMGDLTLWEFEEKVIVFKLFYFY